MGWRAAGDPCCGSGGGGGGGGSALAGLYTVTGDEPDLDAIEITVPAQPGLFVVSASVVHVDGTITPCLVDAGNSTSTSFVVFCTVTFVAGDVIQWILGDVP